MRRLLKPIVLLWAAWVAASDTAFAQATGAISSGNWENASIWTAGTVPNATNNVYIGATYPPGSASTATVTLTANESANVVLLAVGLGEANVGTLNLGNYSLTISDNIYIGQAGIGTLEEGSGGSFTAPSAYVEHAGNSLNFGANDAVSYLELDYQATATTAGSGNVSGHINVNTGSTLTLGANLSITGTLAVEDSGSVLDMGGHSITANEVHLGYFDGVPVTLENRGALSVTNLYVGNGKTFNLIAADSVTNFFVDKGVTTTLNSGVTYLQVAGGSSATTTAAGSISGAVSVYSGSTLTLGTNLNISGLLDVVQAGSTLNAQGHSIGADSLIVGYGGSLTNLGQVTLNSLEVDNGGALTLHGGDVVNGQITLNGGGTLSVMQLNGIGLTYNGTSDGFYIDQGDNSVMQLIFTSSSSPTWDFRWQDPSGGGNWIQTIQSMIGSGEITMTGANAYTVYDAGGFTYIGSASVPEPSSLVLACLAFAGVTVAMARKHRRSI